MKKFILFDHDGVLVDTENWYFLANQRALAELGIDLLRDAYLKNMANGISSWTLARSAGIDEERINKCRVWRDRFYQEYLASEDIEIDGVIETLKELSSDYHMAIVTTSKKIDFELIHRDRKITDYIEFVLTVEDYTQAKPHPEPYLNALKRFDTSAQEAVVIEDSARGLKSAVAAGIDCIVVQNDFTESHDFNTASRMIQTIQELPKTILELSTA